ncbi:hypothetical protein CANARDRAFT_26545 [[Candida] arabinofermentans NRRL YB-2248]|uniref:Elongator complex protein 4 n=1 Tax=[Candida] arabinofermentans NRRL YB-2248 TaxID=983967 RepID=A0A1E4T5S7_9ASCO|nr:hypothetical protein CANARDRAFT_26545 [[Candida] arabinofermentans NRRL YB-2248]
MSFRKRGEIVGSPNVIPSAVPGRGGAPPAAPPVALPNTRQPPAMQSMPSSFRPAVQGRSAVVPQRGSVPGTLGNLQLQRPNTQQQHQQRKDEQPLLGSHPGVRPSILTSEPCISTGSSDIDKILAHQGLPIGTSLLIEENGTTDFSSTLLKIYLSQGIVQNRLNPSSQNTHLILVGLDQTWAKTLPGVYKGSSKERKKLAVKENESKVSVSNLIDSQQQQQLQLQKEHILAQKQKQQQQESSNNDLKIAWRYGLQRKSEKSEDLSESQYPNYNNQFDITSTLIPSASPKELTSISIPTRSKSYDLVLKQIEQAIQRQPPNVLIRIAVPLFLNPMIYHESQLQTTTNVIQFIHGLKRILKTHQSRTTLLISLNLDLFPRSNPMTSLIEMLSDAIIELRPFDPQLYNLMEKIYKNQPAKIKHGHLNIHKLPTLSDVGLMCVQDMEYSFKNGKKKFQVEEWSIPVEEEDTDNHNANANSSSAHGHDEPDVASVNPMSSKRQTTTDIEF